MTVPANERYIAKGQVKRLSKGLLVLATMLLSGVWHGAGIPVHPLGALPGFYVVVNHAWQEWRPDATR